MMVIFPQMTLNKCKKKKDKMDNLHNWPTDRTLNKRNSLTIIEVYKVFNCRQKSGKSPVFSIERSPTKYSKFLKI